MSVAGDSSEADRTALTVEIRAKVYGAGGPEPVEAVRDLAFCVPTRAITCLIGPSGAGKTTTLRILLGLDTAFDGHVTPSPDTAGIAMVFQEPRLLAWRTVEQNVRLALPRPERQRPLDTLFESLGLTPWRGRYPGALSLGMQRRVALARALAQTPRILILDEPFVSLDDASAAALRGLVVDSVADTGVGVLMVTHNVAEAIAIADRLVLVSARPASLVATVALDRPRDARDRVWAETTRADLASHYPGIIAV
ncbi:Aliphatic sulfonates import ATP-binding protein SsuB [Methylobacterium adhaesivum]|jgi:NitT/TauT family transport system ATP-binding protein|uniref:ATP-binding cassette domain-containing protein n=1 Tax=Methylobacterium adhaesivum TaxID=333297 RepID=A0ABT8BAT0_9HYPH|nr:ATP-binding cassette domain-containing protein [Methylobacterium adhaesivum]MDN3589127.1 ATP-binding cassette domain-containing protein [Methylobacterium adhaesivum]GJD32013.1 Aliphatic sulfonates import ATP-binding protein SsuB [Methylobacterium adhaesivum]